MCRLYKLTFSVSILAYTVKINVLNIFFFYSLERWVLEQAGTLEPRKSALEDDFEEDEEKEEDEPADISEVVSWRKF